MEPQTWDRIQKVYYQALPLPRAARNDFVARACDFDPFLTREVSLLLQAGDGPVEFLDAPVFALGLKLISSETPELLDEPFADDLVGSTIDGRYVIERFLEKGGMACVYLARDIKLYQREVVIKVLLEKSLRNEWIVRKFRDEGEALARVNHPGVVNILDAGELADKKPYLTMQYVDGISLRAVITATPYGLEFQRAASIIRGISSALNAVHQKRIYHRDLKPENIMLQSLGPGEEQVKILDFGVAKVKESLSGPSTATGQASAGTALYMSPEHLRGDKVTAATDVYSLAIIAYEMLTGRLPLVAETIGQLADMQRRGVKVKPTDLRERLPKRAEAIILRGLEFDPLARDVSAGEFGEQLARALISDEPEPVRDDPPQSAGNPNLQTTVDSAAEQRDPRTTSPKTETTVNSERKLSAKRWWLIAAAALLVGLVGIGGYWLIFRKPSKIRSASSEHRTLAYWLEVQKMRDGQPYKDPFVSSGDVIFESGYQFRLNVSSRQSGYLYVFNEGPPENGKIPMTIIYPTPKTNNGSARVEQNQDVQTNWNTFSGGTGTEHLWIIWAEEKVTQLEIALSERSHDQEGVISSTGPAADLKQFLIAHSNPPPATTKDTPKNKTTVYADGDLLVKLLELEHR